MAAKDLTSPLLPSPPSHRPHHIVSIRDDCPPPHSPKSQHPSTRNQNHTHDQNHRGTNQFDVNPQNPFAFLGSSGVKVPPPATVDPFRNSTPRIEGFYELLKMAICLPIALARLVLFGTCLLLGFLATKLALYGWKDKHNPMPRWRCRLMWVTRVCARCILFSFGYHWIKPKGRPAPRETAPIVVSNHVSFIEPIFYFYELFPTIVASESHDSLPFVGTIIRAMQVIYVNRFVPSSRKHAVNEIKRKASCDRFPRLLLFPEGTTTNGRVLLSFQLGAFIPCYPIQPVIVRYPHVHFDQSWGNVSLAKLMGRMFLQFHNFLEVEYLPVVSPLQNHKENPVHFAERTGRSLATALNVTQTYHSYGDLMLLTKASESTQGNPSNYMVEMARVESIFGFVDTEKIGAITFKQFLYASAHVKKLPLFQQGCELAFAQCDSEGNNYISEQEIGDFIRPAIPDIDEDEIHELCKLFNSDSDGTINKDAFLNCLRKNPLLIAVFSTHFLQSMGRVEII